MSDNANGGGEKNLDPTAKKTEDARKKGDVVRSTDIAASASYLGLVVVLSFAGAGIVKSVGKLLSAMLATSHNPSNNAQFGGQLTSLPGIVLEVVVALAPVFGFPMALVLLSIFAQRAFVFAPSKLAPKLSRISPVSVAKNKFGPTGLFEFAKSVVKLVLVSLVVANFIAMNSSGIVGSLFGNGHSVSYQLATYLVALLWLIFSVSLGISVVDYLWQSYDHNRKLLMSRQDIADETKGSEGDPFIKQQRRQRGYDIATNRMLVDVPSADVIIVNPEHFAVALKWSRDSSGAPICVAKGKNEVAARIRETARRAKVPIHSDPPTARALFASVELGQEIHPDHYRAVAAAIRFSEKVRNAVKRGEP